MAQAPAYLMKMYMCLLASALSIRWGKSHQSISYKLYYRHTTDDKCSDRNNAHEMGVRRPLRKGSPLRTSLAGDAPSRAWAHQDVFVSLRPSRGRSPHSKRALRLGLAASGRCLIRRQPGVALTRDFGLEGLRRPLEKRPFPPIDLRQNALTWQDTFVLRREGWLTPLCSRGSSGHIFQNGHLFLICKLTKSSQLLIIQYQAWNT